MRLDLVISIRQITHLGESAETYLNLRGADMHGADMIPAGTRAPIPGTDLSAFKGYRDDGDSVVGYRTKRSTHYGNTVYDPGNEYVAPIFSMRKRECDFGIYMFPTAQEAHQWAIDSRVNSDGSRSIVKCVALRSEGFHAGDKYRFRRILVLEDVK